MILTEYTINDKTYVDVKDIRANHKAYCKGTRSIAQLVERKGFRDLLYGRVIGGDVELTATMSRQNGTTFVNKNEVAELFDSAAPPALPLPPVINDKDLVFFKDDDGEEYQVCMRGKRTRNGIYFKAKDVQEVFQMPNLIKDIVKANTIHEEGRDYVVFLSNWENVSNKQEELYFTYKGLMRVIYRSNSGIAYKFQDWIDECVFAMNWGTKEQKAKVIARALNVDADHIKAIISKCPSSITCLYLIDINVNDTNRKVFKYGYTKNIRRRFNEHMKTYGDDIKLDSFVFVPELDLPKAESLFKFSIAQNHYTGIEARDELISLDDVAYKSVQTIFSLIMDKYCGNIREQTALYECKIQELEAQLLLKDEQSKRVLAEKELELAHKDHQIYEMKIAMLQKK